VNLLGDVRDDTRRYLGHVGERAARKSEQAEMDGETQTTGGSAMTADDPEVAGRQRVDAAEVAFGQIGGDAHERIALLSSQQTGCLGYHAVRSMQPVSRTSLAANVRRAGVRCKWPICRSATRRRAPDAPGGGVRSAVIRD